MNFDAFKILKGMLYRGIQFMMLMEKVNQSGPQLSGAYLLVLVLNKVFFFDKVCVLNDVNVQDGNNRKPDKNG